MWALSFYLAPFTGDFLGVRNTVKRNVVFALVVVLASLSLTTPGLAATPPKVGSTCTKLNQVLAVTGSKFTCVRSGKKLVWKVSKSPVPVSGESKQLLAPTSFKNLVQNQAGISLTTWQKIHSEIVKNSDIPNNVEIVVGPHTIPDDPDPMLRIVEVRKLFSSFKIAKNVTIINGSYIDKGWSQDKLSTLCPQNQCGYDISNEIAKQCNGDGQTCFGGVGFTNSVNGDGIIFIGAANSTFSSDYYHKGPIEAHEFTHVIQKSQFTGKLGSLGFIPRWLVEGQAELNAVDFGFGESFEIAKSWRSKRVVALFKNQTSYSAEWIQTFLNPPTDSTSPELLWSKWDGYSTDQLYSMGLLATEALIAISNPSTPMQLFTEVAGGVSFQVAFQKIYAISWSDASNLLSQALSAELSYDFTKDFITN
jgi:hypothetical protein